MTQVSAEPAAPGRRVEPVAFTADGWRLRGHLHLPASAPPFPLVVGSHGLYSSGSSAKQIALAERLAPRGAAFLRFDHRGCGESAGRFADVTTLEGRSRDLLAAVACLRQREDIGPALGLFGSSLGGAACLAAWKVLKPRRTVVVAAPCDSRSILEGAGMEADPGTREIFGAPHFQFDLAPELPRVRHLLVVHGEADQVIPVAHARTIHRLAQTPKRLIVLPGGDHRLSRPDHRETLLAEAADWLAGLLNP